MIIPIDCEERRVGIGAIPGDRRGARRYDIRLSFRWKLFRRRKLLDSGEGQTLDISSGGMLIETGKPLPVGLQLELSVSWPVLLHNVSPLQLALSGRVVRSEGGQTAIRIARHEFRTVALAASARRKPVDVPAQQVAVAFARLGSLELGRIQ